MTDSHRLADGSRRRANPEHESLERLDDKGISVGARLRIREKVAGVPGEYIGELTRVEELSAVTMEAPAARYRLFGIPFTVGEGVTWRIEPMRDHASRISARVWATFPAGLLGRAVEWIFVHLLNGIERDREHARVELRHLKRIIETPLS
ncbi:hypothetical protein [Enemella evansiae]|uniref:hypothetical protein n=1 Tax=Enemella evansiae TaxID=2016499 RepID=UPI00117C9FD1|nr:hypothetical protein [Enemella evansiae]